MVIHIKYPDMYLQQATPFVTDKRMNIDVLGRAVLNMQRDGAVSIPLHNTPEFAAFFSLPNYRYLYATAYKRAGNRDVDPNFLFERMLWGYQAVLPRYDICDLSRNNYSKSVTNKYLKEMNDATLLSTVTSTDMAYREREKFNTWRIFGHKPAYDSFQKDGIDTRTRLNACTEDYSNRWL